MIIGLFFTRGISLELWVSKGLLYREKLIYEKLVQSGNVSRIYWYTYGVNDDKVAKRLYSDGELDPRITVVPMPRFFSLCAVLRFLYTFLLPIVNLRTIFLIVQLSNQINVMDRKRLGYRNFCSTSPFIFVLDTL